MGEKERISEDVDHRVRLSFSTSVFFLYHSVLVIHVGKVQLFVRFVVNLNQRLNYV